MNKFISSKFIISVSLILFSIFLCTGVSAQTLSQRLSGKILLQVEGHGESWYVQPSSGERFYMGRAEDAYDLMRSLGIGITNKDLNKIPVAEANFIGPDTDGDGLSDRIENAFGTNISSKDSDNDSYPDKAEILSGYNPLGSGRQNIDLSFTAKQVGKIFLQVQAHGEAWYVNPDNKKRYYLGVPTDAFALMRSLGLGITNNNLNLIPISRFSKPLPGSSVVTYKPSPVAPVAVSPEPQLTAPVITTPEPLPTSPIVVTPEPQPMPPVVVTPEPQPTPPVVIIKAPVVIPDPLPEPPRLSDIQVNLPSLPVQEISDCKTITESGQYILTADIMSDDLNCFKIVNTQDVSLDCQGHKISFPNPAFTTTFTMDKVNNFKIKSCDFSQSFIINDSHNGVFDGNTFGSTIETGVLDSYSSSYLQFENNTFRVPYQQRAGNHTKLANNHFYPTLAGVVGSCVIVLGTNGSNNEIMFNEIDGRYDGNFNPNLLENVGYDDGICLNNQAEDRIEGNTIRNNWDAGIEGIGNNSNSVIKNNNLINNAEIGIGAWYWSSWWDNTVRDNIIDKSDKLFQFDRLYGLPDGNSWMYFFNNQFINNKFINPSSNQYSTSTIFFQKDLADFSKIPLSLNPGESQITPDKVNIGNNLLMGNDFTKRSSAPLLGPASIFIDGGGNICNTTDIINPYSEAYPISCL